MKIELTKQEILESKQILNEGFIESALMLIGFIPVIGEIADIVLIIWYIFKKEYLYAGLMLIALIPTVGDFIVKPIISLLKGAGTAGKVALRSGDDMVKFATTNPSFAKQYLKIGEHLSNPAIGKTINKIKKVPGFGTKAAEGLEKSIVEHKSILQKISDKIGGSRPAQLGKTIGKEISAGGKFSTGFKNFFRDEKLAQYVQKRGMEPSSWLSKWWNVTMPARKGRRNMVRSFIVTNHILDMFGLPSFDAFQERFQKDKEFRKKLAENPQFSQIVNQTTSPEELSQIESSDQEMTNTNNTRSLGGGNMVSLSTLKQIAQMV